MARSLAHDLAGRVLAGRYLLHQPVGTGASGRVYVAEDTRLRRRVAVKVLHAALAEDAAFLRRFRAEAQVAASLHHPHIVTVHDWGEDDMPFMVQELLEGGSLRSMLDAGAHLSVAQAARVGRDVAAALDYAHARGILHRDIKPANLLFDEHGIVRVADFGLARALAEASWTEPTGAVFGTARYASPEQALGSQLDGRSDLYALALVLVEAVTGQVPFSADTTIGMLAARTQAPLVAPEPLGALAPVVERAGRVEPDERYPDAATMRAALNDVAESLPPPSPLVLAGMADVADPNPTRAQPDRTAQLFDQDEHTEPYEIEVLAEPEVEDTAPPRRLVPFVVAAALIIAVALAAALTSAIGGTVREVPGMVGYSLEEAEARAEDAGIDIEVAEQRNAPDPEGTVIAQDPPPGAFSDAGTVRVVVSSGPAPVIVPEVRGKPFAEAQALLAEAGLTFERREEYFDDVPLDVVASAEPGPGAEVAPDSSVTLVVSLGHEPVAIPDVEGSTFEEAKATLEGLGFTVTRRDEFSGDVDEGEVIGTAPEIGTEAAYQSAVEIVVSRGPEMIAVPDVTGRSVEEASARLEAAGFETEVVGYRPGRPVESQEPEAGEMLERGSTVTLVVGDGNRGRGSDDD